MHIGTITLKIIAAILYTSDADNCNSIITQSCNFHTFLTQIYWAIFEPLDGPNGGRYYQARTFVNLKDDLTDIRILLAQKIDNVTVHFAGCQKVTTTFETTTVSETTTAEQTTTVASTTSELTTPATTSKTTSTTVTSTTKSQGNFIKITHKF